MPRWRVLLTVAALFAATACGGSANATNISGSGTANSGTAASGSHTIAFKETEYTLAPSALTLKPGTYTFQVHNVGQFPHDLHVATSADGTEMAASAVILAGQSNSFTVTLRPGSYTLWCSVDSHRSLGMEGTLTIQ
jgi:plastocyanin